MIEDARAVMWKEWRELSQQRPTRASVLVFLLVFGGLLPYQAGREWVDGPFSILVLSFVPLVLTITIVADSFAGERERHTLETLLATRLSDRAVLFGKVATVVAYSWGGMVAAALLGLVTVNVAHAGSGLLVYRPEVALGTLAVGLGVAVLAASAGILVSLRAASVRQAQQVLGLSLALLIGGSQVAWAFLVGDAAKAGALRFLAAKSPLQLVLLGAAALAAADALLLGACMARFRRSRLVLD